MCLSLWLSPKGKQNNMLLAVSINLRHDCEQCAAFGESVSWVRVAGKVISNKLV